jgi:phosphate transport system permease protein
MTGVVLGMMRAAGEALAVQMVIGNRPIIPTSLTQPMTTLTSQITLDMGNTVTGEPWNQALWTMGLILLLISLGFVILVRRLAHGRTPL